MARGIRATQSNKALRAALRGDLPGTLRIGEAVVRHTGGVPGVVVGIGDGSVFVKWEGYRVVEVPTGRDGVRAVCRPGATGTDTADEEGYVTNKNK